MRVASVAVLSLLLGVASGYVLARPNEARRDLAAELISCEAGNTGTTLLVLEAFRAGNADQGISLLETGLSLHAVVLDEFLGDRELQPSNAPTAKRILRAIATYRAAHPFQHGDAEADRKVEAILASYSSS